MKKHSGSPLIKHIGAGDQVIEGMENSDRDTFNLLSKTAWESVEDDSVDAYVAHHVFQEIPWRNLVPLFDEILRTLRPQGVLRMGVPHIDSGLDLQYILSWGNILLLSEELMKKVLYKVGYNNIKHCNYGETFSSFPLIVGADNRPNETLFLEAFKP